MSQITLNSELNAKLNGLNEQMVVVDSSGMPLGFFLPFDVYRKLVLSGVEVPYSEEEIERRRQEKGGCTLAEFWKKMGQQQ